MLSREAAAEAITLLAASVNRTATASTMNAGHIPAFCFFAPVILA